MGMSYGFTRDRDGRLHLSLDDVERVVLTSLTQQMIDFVAAEPLDPDADPLAALVGIDETAEVPEDPALARLFPDAFRDDPEAAADFRRFTERDLRTLKTEHARTVATDLASCSEVVPDDHAPAWLGFLNDTRLTLGARLEITEDNHDEFASLPQDDPRFALFGVYDWLTFLQDSLVHQLLA
jgi:hypothetical protein